MARMPLEDQIFAVRALYDVHQRHDLGEDEMLLVQLQHDVEERLSIAASLLAGLANGGPR